MSRMVGMMGSTTRRPAAPAPSSGIFPARLVEPSPEDRRLPAATIVIAAVLLVAGLVLGDLVSRAPELPAVRPAITGAASVTRLPALRRSSASRPRLHELPLMLFGLHVVAAGKSR